MPISLISSMRRPSRQILAAAALAVSLSPGTVLAEATAPAVALADTSAILPTGGTVKAGQATIGTPSGGTLVIDQTSSSKAIIDWTGFSIGQSGKVQFNNGSGATLNRVTGSSASSIDGLLSATGSVYLLNPNGVIIGKSGVVDVGGSFVASALNLPNDAFLAGGDLAFAGSSSALVVNYGKIGALGGDVALIASRVENQGDIKAPNGVAALAAGYQVVVRDQSLDGGKYAVLVGGSDSSAVNGGLMAAANAELRAQGGNVYALAGNTSGVIHATGVTTLDGRIFLTAGDSGTVNLAGALTAQEASGGQGQIETSAGRVNIGAAVVDAGQGGTWLLDPNDLNIDQTGASTIAGSLNAGTNVIQQTTEAGTGGAGDITLNAGIGISWNTSANLTFSAFRDINFGASASIISTGSGKVTLRADNTGTGAGAVRFGAGARIQSAGATILYYNPTSNPFGSAVNSASYTVPTDYSPFVTGGGTLTANMLVNTVADLQNMQNNLSGTYALGRDINAETTAGWNNGAGFNPVGLSSASPFTGNLDGQGHSISGLYIDKKTIVSGLFGVTTSGSIENLNILGGSINGALGEAGALVGHNKGAAIVYHMIFRRRAL